MITYNEIYQAQQRYEDLISEAKAARHYNEVLNHQHTLSKLLQHLKAALNKPAPEHKPVISKRLATR